MNPNIYAIELTNECNFNCGYCKRYFSDRKKGFMSLNTVKNSITYLKNSIFVELHMNGESLLHNNFGKIVKLIRPVVPYLGIATNGSLLGRWEEILLLDEITISLHQYKKIDMNLMENFKGLIRFQVLNNQDIPTDFLRNWTCRKNVILDIVEFIDYNKKIKNNEICLDSIFNAVIHWDGDIVPCCKANTKEVVLGNVNDKKIVYVGDYKKWNMCNECRFPNSYLFHMNLLKDIIKVKEKMNE